MATVTIEELKQHVQVTDDKLRLQCSDEHLEEIATKISNWLSYAMALKLEDYQQQAIRVDQHLDYLHKNMEVLKVWKKNNVQKATYLNLALTCLSVGDGFLAGEVCKIAKSALANPDSLDGWFKEIGLMDRDISTLNKEGFATKQAFKHLTKIDLNNIDLTRGGARILETHVGEAVEPPQSSSTTPPQQSPNTTSSQSHQTPPTPASEYLSCDTHLRHVYAHTYGACTKWYNIGLQLGLPQHTLENISRNRGLQDTTEFYREMLTQWMIEGTAKIEQLLVALEGVTVGMKDVAKTVRSLSDSEKQSIGFY